MTSVPERSEIETAYKWALESVYSNDADWEAAYESVETRLTELGEYESQLTTTTDHAKQFSDGNTLLSVLELRDSLMRDVGMVVSYARMRSHEDTRDQTYQALLERARSLSTRASKTTSFIEPAIQSHSRDQLSDMIQSTQGLGLYEHYLDDIIRLKPHTRSAEVEELLSDFGEVFGASSQIYNFLMNADLSYPTIEHPSDGSVEITQSNFTKLLKEPDREFRHTVYESLYETLGDVRNTIGSSLRNSVKSDVKLARTRGYETARAAALDGPKIPISVYDTLLDTVSDHLDLLHQHVELKRDSLGVSDLKMWDIYMPLVTSESPTLSYEDATEHVVESVAPLGEEYQSQVEQGFDDRWIDVYENRGKQSGAYSGGTYDTHPFILMNWQDDVSSMFTLAHELGHSLHSELASDHQPYVYSGYEIFVAEVASTVNETLLTHHLLDTVSDEEFRRHVLNEYLERFRSTLFRQTMFADFEYQIHSLDEDGDALTPDRFDSLYRELKATYYEPAVIDDLIAREWMRIPHFYYNYYVYQYATGISAAVAIVQRILDEGADARDDYLAALKLGGSVYPLEVLETAGIDMTSPRPIVDALAVYESRLKEFESLLA